MTTPRTRAELFEQAAKAAFGPADESTAPNWLFVDRAAKVIEAIEALGLEVREPPAETMHDEQIDIWVDEMIDALIGHLKEPESYDDKVHLHNAIKGELESIRAAVTANPFAKRETT